MSPRSSSPSSPDHRESEWRSLSLSDSNDHSVSSSSATTTYTDIIDTTDSDNRHQSTESLRTLDLQHQPYSNLSELVQKGVLSKLVHDDLCRDLDVDPSSWKARVLAYCCQLGTLAVECTASNKQVAKGEAAQQLLKMILDHAH